MSDIRPIVMPKWGLAMIEGTIVEWQVEAGAEVAEGQDIMEIETSKITNVFESPVGGPLRRIVVEGGETVPVGALLGVCAPASVSDEEVEAYVKDFVDNFDWDAAADAGGPATQTIEVAGKRTRFLKQGDAEGTPILLIHGFGGDCLGWMFNQEALAETFTTYALDLPGHGGSSKDVGDGTMAVLVKAALDFMDSQDIAKAHLVGHSMGGAVSLALALEHGERVASLSLLAPAGLGTEINMDYINGFIDQKRAKKLRGVLELLVADPGMITNEMVEEVIKYKRLDGAAEALATLRDGLFTDGAQVTLDAGKVAALSLPAVVLWGESDQILPISQIEALPASATATRLPDCGHLPHMEKASEVNEAVLALIS
ncbi:MAG: acetoin dehydrogenase dihydrolipoyllysine-residue acetyltransferase subunit [Rhodospirillales bacterium]